MKKDSYSTIRESKTLRTLFFILLGGVFAGLLYIFRFYLWPFMVAFMLYMALWPAHEKLFRLIKKRSISSSLIMILLLIIIAVPFFYLMASLSKQGIQLGTYVDKQINSGVLIKIKNSDVMTSITEYLDISKDDLFVEIKKEISKKKGQLLEYATTIISWPITFMMKFFFMLLILFFLFKDGTNLTKMIYDASPFPDDIEELVGSRLIEVVKVLLAGNLIMMLLQGFMVGIALYFVGNKTFLLWGSIAAILSLIPVIGTSFIWVPGVIYLVLTRQYASAIFLGAWCLSWYLLLENVIKPKVFGKKLNFHPILFFFLLLGSLQAFGIAGVFIGPILLTLFYSLWEIYKILYKRSIEANSQALQSKSLPNDSNSES